MNIPSLIRAGDTIVWDDVATKDNLGNLVTSTDYSLTYYLRTNSSSNGAIVAAVPNNLGWRSTIASSVSTGFVTGTWYFQAVASKTGSTLTIGSGQFTVEPSLAYAGAAGAYDGRSQAEKDLEAVTGAIRSMISGGAVQRYLIAGRELWKIPMQDLLLLQSRLKAEVAREKKAEMIANGLGNPHSVYVRF